MINYQLYTSRHRAYCDDAVLVVEPKMTDVSAGRKIFVEQKIEIQKPENRWHEAIYPRDSILHEYMEFARECEESADCYLLGAILPVAAACLGRNVWMPFRDAKQYPNVFSIIVGKPGDRKSSAINLARRMAKRVLPEVSFLPENCSAEALFDEYCEAFGGCPDKLLVVDDANATLSNWAKSSYGECVCKKFLSLYDACSLSEAFRRNKKSIGDETQMCRRFIPETSTSVIFGATFNIAQFQGQQVRDGLARRFLYYIAESRGRTIDEPQSLDLAQLQRLQNQFAQLTSFREVACKLAPEAKKRWSELRAELDAREQKLDGHTFRDEAELSRLSSQPMQTLKIAMIFEACRRVYLGASWDGTITLDSLQSAIAHVQQCMHAAAHLDKITHRADTRSDADVVYAQIQRVFPHKREGAEIVLGKTDLTYAFCKNSGRPGSLTTEKLYHKVLPDLISRGLAAEVQNEGKAKYYVFKIEN